MACGEIGLTIQQAYHLTPREFFNITTGHRQQRVNQWREQLELTKVECYFIYCSIPKKKGAKRLTFAEFSERFFSANQPTDLEAGKFKKRMRTFWKELDEKRAKEQKND